jgi:hypothetical protein
MKFGNKNLLGFDAVASVLQLFSLLVGKTPEHLGMVNLLSEKRKVDPYLTFVPLPSAEELEENKFLSYVDRSLIKFVLVRMC